VEQAWLAYALLVMVTTAVDVAVVGVAMEVVVVVVVVAEVYLLVLLLLFHFTFAQNSLHNYIFLCNLVAMFAVVALQTVVHTHCTSVYELLQHQILLACLQWFFTSIKPLTKEAPLFTSAMLLYYILQKCRLNRIPQSLSIRRLRI
jgi:hypothetical protein